MATRRQARAEKPATIRTDGGREVRVGRLTLEEAAPIGRVILRVTCQRAERGHLWASLTAAEARRLAADLLGQAAAVDRLCRPRIGRDVQPEVPTNIPLGV
jgi:hypothetical protein